VSARGEGGDASARIVLGSYLIRYPLGGMISNVLQWLVGLQRLGHDVYFVEKSGYPNSCYDPARDRMSDDCSYGLRVVNDLLSRFGLEDRWCYVDAGGGYHGMPRERVEGVLGTADVFVDMGTHGSWLPEAAGARVRVLVDGEPGFTQMRMELGAGDPPSAGYDRYYTVGQNIGGPASSAPTAGKEWRTVFHPVVPELFDLGPPPPGSAYTTVMNWQSHEPLDFEGRRYGQKDVEFGRFFGLPELTGVPLEVAVSGKGVPLEELRRRGWRIRDGHEVTMSFDSFRDYIASSRGEFGVCKNVFVATRSGWFSDRSAAYLAAGRPVVLQDTGFGAHLPTGTGLFAVGSAEEAAAALEEIERDHDRHAKWAREIAVEHLDAGRVLPRFLEEIRGSVSG